MIRVMIFLSKTTAEKIHLYKPILNVFSKNSSKFHCEGPDGWSLTTVGCSHQLKLRLAPLSGGSDDEGCPRAASVEHLGNTRNTRRQFRLPPSEAVLFPNKGC